ncbi:MAG TPA: SH3 domain-containing protein [Urbifossiella sp.]|nr:SH3 domain-containing protein [Urbifossiella sp.]
MPNVPLRSLVALAVAMVVVASPPAGGQDKAEKQYAHLQHPKGPSAGIKSEPVLGGGELVALLPNGTKVQILQVKGDPNIPSYKWYQVKVVDGGKAGVVGWASFEVVKVAPPAAALQGTKSPVPDGVVARARLLLTKPDLGTAAEPGNQVGTAPVGTLLRSLDKEPYKDDLAITWRRVAILSGDLKGKNGWVAANAVTKVFEIRLQAFIPAPVVGGPFHPPVSIPFPTTFPPPPDLRPLTPAVSGDNRTFEYDAKSSRAKQQALVAFGNVLPHKGDGVIFREWGVSHAYFPFQAEHVPGKVWWWHRLKSPDAPALRTEELEPADANSKVTIVSDEMGERVTVRLQLNGTVPVADFAPEVNADLTVQLRRIGKDDDRVEFKVVGTHDRFPSYELYINARRVYEYDVSNAKLGPFGLFPAPPIVVERAGPLVP